VKILQYNKVKKIEIDHGSGGKLTRDLIEDMYLKYFNSEELKLLEDAAIITLDSAEMALTTDSYVIHPLFFPGGNIGKLSVCGTVNDLLVTGARPKYISVGFILEEGFPLDRFEHLVQSLAATARLAGVKVVAGDTKVVEKSKCDGIYINTSGIGEIVRRMSLDALSEGDAVLVTGTVGDHGTAIVLARNEFDIGASVQSDCAPLQGLLSPVFNIEGLKWMRDPTRGGVATVLVELSQRSGLGVEVIEENVPVRDDVRFIQDMLGYDPLYLANEGKAVIVTSGESAQIVLDILKGHPLGINAAVIGSITSRFKGVRLKTRIGGERVMDMLEQEMLPRIC
jgi:hydrogenase expression/formation protein HypE